MAMLGIRKTLACTSVPTNACCQHIGRQVLRISSAGEAIA